ncbi:BglII/BstYI family type II restriction endonuclease [Pseudaestuariivita sp.]|uniref:BglII/BstYI family type II restriction endonuclease n=1 Tax=Pseudaestuariivita sp. TaxID=2211669 RepID=UPI0040591C82
MFDRLRALGFDVLVRNHAEAVLQVDFPEETETLVSLLASTRMSAAELIGSGGGEAPSTQRIRRVLSDAGWLKHNFRIETTVDGVALGGGTSHEIDHVKQAKAGRLALEIEWNNKDPFFDRDLENFQRLHAQSIISAGIVVTRGAALQAGLTRIVETYLRAHDVAEEADLLHLGMKDRTARQRTSVERAMAAGADFPAAFARFFVADKYGIATTHWSKLTDRIARGVGNPCPLLLIGLPASIVTEDG